MNPRAVIFDLGGTIVDKYSLSPIRSLSHAFRHSRCPISDAHINRYMGLDKQTHIRHLLQDLHDDPDRPDISYISATQTENTIDALYSAFRSRQQVHLLNYSKLIPGFSMAYDHLRSKNIPLGITTGYSREETESIVDSLTNNNYLFESVVSSSDVEQGRPHPDMILQNLKNLGVDEVDSGDVIKLDDSIYGIEEGLNAGCISIGVVRFSTMMNIFTPDGDDYLTPSEIYQKMYDARVLMKKAGAHFVIDDLTELKDIME
jgi:phosphonoacetaldehyde hydrolase